MFELQQSQPHLRIAFYGYAGRDDGSVSSAGFVILRELLDRGHEIDLFGKRSFAFPFDLERYPNFRFIDTEDRIERYFGKGCGSRNRVLRLLACRLTSYQTSQNVPKAIKAEHIDRSYDVCLYFGTWAFARVASLPTISWIQGPHGTDSRSIARHAQQLRRLEGTLRYVALRLTAVYRQVLAQPPYQNSDAIICGSAWTIADLRSRFASNVSIYALPYPVDLNYFSSASHDESAKPLILWAGRSVPRKRLDLFLDACSDLLNRGFIFDIKVVCDFNFAPGYARLINEFRHPERLTYVKSVPRQQMPQLYRQATVLVQPSEDENFGSAVAEALACGTTVVLGPSNGTADYIGTGGFQFTQYEVPAVAAAIAEALKTVAENHSDASKCARVTAEKFFDVKTIVTQLEGFISQVSNRPVVSTKNSAKELSLNPANGDGVLLDLQKH